MASHPNGESDPAALERELARTQEALERLQQSQALLLSTLDAASDGICTLQLADNAFFYNIRFVELWGIPEDKLSDMDADALLEFQLTQVKDREGWLTLVQQRRNNPDEEGVSIVELKDGRVLERHVLPQRMGGRSVGSVIIFRDITEQRRQQEEIRRARDIAEQATRMKSEFLANMSHEIRTPMNAVIGLTHLALGTALTARQRDYIEKVQASAQHLLGIINDILDFSKIEAGRLDLDHSEFELEGLLTHTANLVSERCHAKGLELVFDVGPDVPAVLVGDSLRLGQVLLNYANNAVKFTEKGDIVISVGLAGMGEDHALLKFEVRDTGIGLSDEQRGRLFESFTQGDASTTRKFGGSGLGLAICKRLAALMGGEVGVDSTPGQGSRFWFTARLGITPDAPRPLVPRPEERGRHALVVDDNEHARHAIAQMLQGMTFETAEACDGPAALEEVVRAAALGHPYDVVYLDWRMPGLDGLEVARQLHALELKSPPLILMVTAYGREDALKAARACGIADVLVKPVSPSLLFDATMEAMGAGRRLSRTPVSTGADVRLDSVRDARILLVEDNEINQQVARELLQDAGMRVDVAGDGKAALAMLAKTEYDLVFMDMQMPEMDGLEATRALRRDPSFAALPVVAMTANAMDQDRQSCLEAGMNDFLVKPVKPRDLYAVLLRWIPARPLSPATPRRHGRDVPENIAELNTALGLENMGGKRSLYRAILRRFLEGQRDIGPQIRRKLAAGDWSGAHRLVHNLKSMAGSIGASGIQAQSEAMQKALNDREAVESLHIRLVQLELSLNTLFDGLEAQLGPADGPPEGYGDPALAA